MVMEGKWIRFEEQPQTGKTKVLKAINKEYGHELGEIRWYGRWRKYCFMPAGSHLVFEQDCLRDIALFLDKLMLQYKTQKQQEKENQK